MEQSKRIRFCLKCNNMLYPRDNPKEQKLEYFCRQEGCKYIEQVDINGNYMNYCVFVNELIKDSSTKLEVLPSDLKSDPSLQRSRDIKCVECGNNEAVLFLAEQTSKTTALNLIFICCNCGKKWLQEPVSDAV